MSLLKSDRAAQSIIEYVLLTAISITALMVSTDIIVKLKNNAFENHFRRTGICIAGVEP